MGWPDDETRVSEKSPGRGNGWLYITLADALDVIPRDNPLWDEFAGYLEEMVVNLPELQDENGPLVSATRSKR